MSKPSRRTKLSHNLIEEARRFLSPQGKFNSLPLTGISCRQYSYACATTICKGARRGQKTIYAEWAEGFWHCLRTINQELLAKQGATA